MKKVYVAGKYDDDNVISILENMRLGMKISTLLLLRGFAPFVPWFDYHFILMRPDGTRVTKAMYQRYSMAWLEASDYVLTLINWKRSDGAKKEITRALELDIPVYYSVERLIREEGK